MSTLVSSPANFQATQTKRAVPASTGASIFSLVLTYAVVAVLIYLAVRSAFSFEFVADSGSVSNDAGGTFQRFTTVSAFAIMLGVMLPVCKSIWRLVKQYPIAFVLPVWATLTTFWSAYPVRSIAAGIQVTILTLFGFYIPVRFTPRQQMQLFVFAGLMTTLLSFATILLLPSAGIDHKNSTIGLEGIFPQKNICAVITIELLTAGFCYTFRGRNAPAKKLTYFILLLSLIVGTMARTGWILLILVAVFIPLLKGLHRLRPLERFVVTYFIPAVSALSMWLVYDNSEFLLHLIGKGATLSGRTGVWAVVFLAIVKKPLLGFGYAAFWIKDNPEAIRLAQAINDPTLSNAENGVLQVWLELGFVGVVMLFVVLFRTCKNAVVCFRSNTPNYAIWYMSILFITMLALVDGSKFMLWTSIDWMMYIMADVGLANEARRIRAVRTA